MTVKTELIQSVQPGEDEHLTEFLTFRKERSKKQLNLPKSRFSSPIPKERSFAMRLIIIMYELERMVFKGIYFYLYPYMVLFLSYYFYERYG